MAQFDPVDEIPGAPPTPEIPKFMIKMQGENRLSIAPEIQATLQLDINNYRKNSGVVRIDIPQSNDPVQGGTVAVIRTDIPGLDGRPIGGASPEAIPAHIKNKPGTGGGSEFVLAHPRCKNHAERVALENLRIAIEGKLATGELQPSQLMGCRVIMRVEQEPCNFCAGGLGATKVKVPGVIKQFSTRFPALLVEVRSPRASRSYLVRAGNVEP